MDRSLLKSFWKCGDNQIIEFAIERARLNKQEREVVECLLDRCMTQEETAEYLNWSVRKIQDCWHNATDKLLSIPWVDAYAKALREK